MLTDRRDTRRGWESHAKETDHGRNQLCPHLDLSLPASAPPGSQTPSLQPCLDRASQAQTCLDLNLQASALPGSQILGLQPCLDCTLPTSAPPGSQTHPASALPGSQTPSLSPAWISDSQAQTCLDFRLPASAEPGPQIPRLRPAWISHPQPQPCLDLSLPASRTETG